MTETVGKEHDGGGFLLWRLFLDMEGDFNFYGLCR